MAILCEIRTDVFRLEKMAEHMECLRGLFVPQCEAVTTLGSKQDEGISK
jgi:hypothetical protein